MHSKIKPGIDAVVTWVNGEDPVHREKLNAYLASIGHRPKIANRNRYRETGEFAYCIASLLKFAPWLRRIHIVADAQTPEFLPLLQQSGWADRVRMVDHTQLFKGYESHLPTFNIRSIKSMFWNIPDLADQFVFLNDDFMLMRPLQPEHWFQDGKPVLTGRWMPQRPGVVAGQLIGRASNSTDKRPGNHLAQAYSARLAGYRFRYFKVPHKPHPLLKPVMERFLRANPALLQHNIQFPLRDQSQFLADSLTNHLTLKEKLATVNNRFKTLRFKPGDYQQPRFSTLLSTIESNPSILYACFQSLETMGEALRTDLFNWLDHRIGKPDDIFRTGPVGAPV
jgi:hypothetical protein